MRVRSFAPAVAAVAFLLTLLPAGQAGRVWAKPHDTPTPAPTAVPSEDPVVTAIAHREFVAWQIGVVNKSRYEPSLAANMTDDKVKQVSSGLASLGTLQHSEFLGSSPVSDAPAGMTVRSYLYHMVCSGGAVYLHLLLSDPSNKVAGIVFRDKLQDEADATPVPTPH